MNKAVIHTALIALGAYAVIALVQSKTQLPVVGAYLPGGKTAV